MTFLPIALLATAATTLFAWAGSRGTSVATWQGENPNPAREDNPPPWAQDPQTWERARKQVEPYWDRYDEPWAVVTHVYQRMGGRVD